MTRETKADDRPEEVGNGLVLNGAVQTLGRAISLGLADRAAVVSDEGELTYGELDDLAGRFANGLRAQGVLRQDRVLFICKDSLEFMAGYLGAMKIGAVPVAFSIRTTAREVAYVIEDSGCTLILIDHDLIDVLGDGATSEDGPKIVVIGGPTEGRSDGRVGLSAFLESQSPDADVTPMAPDDMLLWFYSSGTTGQPKGAVHVQSSAAIAHRQLEELAGVKPGDRIFATSKMFFAYALGHLLLGGLRAGATIVLHGGWADPKTVAGVLERHRPDIVFSVPTLYRNMISDGVVENAAFGKVRFYISAGEKLPVAQCEAWEAATGVPLLECIGTSESLYPFIMNTPSARRPGVAGKPAPWVQVRLVSDEGEEITEPDTPGILWIQTPSLACCYWNKPEASADALQEGWYKTGDMFTFDAEGWWCHQGRGDDMLKISGQWVSPTEIEECVLVMPEVADAVVAGLPNQDGLVRAALFVVPADGPEADEAALKAAISLQMGCRLPVYKCPRDIRLIAEVPRTATGKPQRLKLRQHSTV